MIRKQRDEQVIFKKIIKIKPNDTLFLGNGKGFNKGENQWINTMLMPYPSTVYGSICSLMLSEDDYRKKKYVNEKEESSNPQNYLSIGNIYLYDNNGEVYIPAPLDLYIDDKEECFNAGIKKLKSNVTCSLEDMEYLFFNNRNGRSERCDGMFVTLNSFYNSYCKSVDGICFNKPCNIVGKSYKVGIDIGEDGIAKEGNLYRLDLIEFNKNSWSYLVEYHIKDEWWIEGNKKSLSKGFLKLGGENKSCKFYSYDRDEIMLCKDYVYEIKNENEFIKVVFTSPCIFKDNNWKPSFNKDIKVVLASIGKAHNLGGFDMVLKKAKPMRKAIPAGSVYVLKSNDFKGKSLKQIKKILLDEIKNKVVNYASGFGQFEVAKLNEI